MLLIAGVLFFFDENRVKDLFNDFHTFLPGAEVIFDYASSIGIKISNKKVIENGGMDKSSYLKWGIRNILEIEKWNSDFKVISHMPIFKGHKNMKFSFINKIGMHISDTLSIMSLAHIKIY